jgi:hypothetical protein
MSAGASARIFFRISAPSSVISVPSSVTSAAFSVISAHAEIQGNRY